MSVLRWKVRGKRIVDVYDNFVVLLSRLGLDKTQAGTERQIRPIRTGGEDYDPLPRRNVGHVFDYSGTDCGTSGKQRKQ